VIVAQEMEDAVDQQVIQFILQGDAFALRVAKSRIHRNDDISQQGRIDVAEFAFPHGK